jgi:D-alanine--D-alanine ligase
MEDSQPKYDVTVLMGGPGSEREVSLMSGQAVAAGLEAMGHCVTRADITPHDTSALDRSGIDAVFIALHGDFGESGEVQKLCQAKHLPYTGSGPYASRLGMDKAAAKQIFLRAGLATPDWMIIEKFHKAQEVSAWLGEISPPVVVKPVDGGSSVDVYICQDAQARAEALEELLDVYDRAMVERFVRGREFTVSILGQTPLPLLEIVPSETFYDDHAMYEDDAKSGYVFDHGLSPALAGQIQAQALTAHKAQNCQDFSRVDFMLDKDNNPQVLEINTIPGFTAHSLLPMAAKQAGIEFPQLVDKILALALAGARQDCQRKDMLA